MSQTQIQTAQDRFQVDPEFRAAFRRLGLREDVWEQIVKTYRRRAEEDGLTQVEWATRCGRTPAQMSRLIAKPSNLTVDSIADALSALDAYLQVAVVDAKPIGGQNCTHTSICNLGRIDGSVPLLKMVGAHKKTQSDAFIVTYEPS